MAERAYTVRELDELRRVLCNKYLWGTYGLPMGKGQSRCYREDEMTKIIEEQVRTHMLAGHTADDLQKSESE